MYNICMSEKVRQKSDIVRLRAMSDGTKTF